MTVAAACCMTNGLLGRLVLALVTPDMSCARTWIVQHDQVDKACSKLPPNWMEVTTTGTVLPPRLHT